MNPEQVERLVWCWRQRDETVVFTNGCFDLLHAGHRWLLEKARRLGQRLIVAVNSDDYCRRVKGTGRPIESHGLRQRNVAAASRADAVLELIEDDPTSLLSRIKPDLYVLGSDYRGRPIAGAGHCGQIVFVERLVGLSTTVILSSMSSRGPEKIFAPESHIAR